MTLFFKINDESGVGEARRAAVQLASRLHYAEVQSGQLALIVSEAARNLVRHAGGGELLLRVHHDTPTVHILALDKGPGIADISRSLKDGYSTAGTAGTGLGAIRRLTTEFDIYAPSGSGTALFACYAPQDDCEMRSERAALQVGIVHLPIRGEEVAGDSWGVKRRSQRDVFMVCDGLGHGPQAAQAAHEAQRLFYERDDAPGQFLERADGILRATRGAALAITQRESDTEEAVFAGVGNISATLCWGDKTQGLMSHNGIVGGQIRKISEIPFVWPNEATLIMHSDGLSSGWALSRYPGLIMRHPALIAGVLYRDFTRGRDDITVLVARPTLEP